MATALIDTNLTLLLIVGLTDRTYIQRHKRTREFIPEDYDQLLSLLEEFNELWITSHCLAEVSNLLKQTNEQQGTELLQALSEFSLGFNESHIQKASIFSNENYLRLGVADAGFVQKSKRVNCSFTVDFDLYQTVSRYGRKIINFNHVRAKYLYS